MDERAHSLAQRVVRLAQQREQEDFTHFVDYSNFPRELLADFRAGLGDKSSGEAACGILADVLYQVANNETRRGGRFRDSIESLQELQSVLRQAVDALVDALMGESTKVRALAGIGKVMQRRSFSRVVEERSVSNWVQEQGSQAQGRVSRTLNAAIEVNRPFRY